MNYTYIGRATREGHRYFLDETGRIAIADQSSPTPDSTEDGPRYIKPGQKPRPASNNPMMQILALERPDGSTCQTIVSERDVVWLEFRGILPVGEGIVLQLVDVVRDFLAEQKNRSASNGELCDRARKLLDEAVNALAPAL
jgi:hypothetical protein